MSDFLENVLKRLLKLGLAREHADELAPRLELEALRYVHALVAAPLVARVMASGELADEWPLYSDVRFDEGPACEALATWALGQKLKAPTLWHPDVTRNEIAEALERATGDDADTARWVGEMFRSGSFVMFDGCELERPGEPFFQCSGHGSGWCARLNYYVEEGWAERKADHILVPKGIDDEVVKESYRVRAEMALMMARVADLFLARRWFDVRAVALVVAALRRVRTEAEPLAAYPFAVRNVRLLCEGELGGNHTRTRVVAAAIDHVRANEGISPSIAADAISTDLEVDLRAHLDALSEALPLDGEAPDDDDAARAAFRRLNEAYAAYVAGTGRNGSELAAATRRHPSEGKALWRLWADPNGVVPGCRFAIQLGRAVLLDIVLPRLEETARNPPALVYQVHESAAALFSRRVRIECNDGQMALPLREGAAVRLNLEGLALADARALAKVRQGVALFGSVVGHRVIRDQIFTGHRQALEHNPDPRIIVIAGGWTAYAERLKMHGKKAAEQVRNVVEAEHACEIPLPDGSFGRLLSREFRPARGHQPALLKLVLGTALLPHYVKELQREMGLKAKTLDGRAALRLVPVLPLPPFAGNRANEQGPQATLSMDVVAHFRENARELAEEGGAPMPLPVWLAMVKGADVPVSMALAVLDRWTRDGDDGPAFLKRVGPDRYTLGDAHAAARAFIENAGRLSLERSEAGRRSVAARANKIRSTGAGGRRGRI